MQLLKWLSLSILVLFFGCNTGINQPDDLQTGSQMSSILKRVPFSTTEDWPTQKYNNGCWEEDIDKAISVKRVYFQTYGFEFRKGAQPHNYYTSTVQVYVNNVHVGEMWVTNRILEFTFDNKSMRVEYTIDTFLRDNTCTEPEGLDHFYEPSSVTVTIYEIVPPDAPAGFLVTPALHSNLNQTVTISWNASTDPDVTGYEIYRGRYSYYNGNLAWQDYTLFQTINSRTITSIQDLPSWGVNAHQYIAYWYKMRAISTTTNTQSGFTGGQDSHLLQYDAILP